MALGWQLVMALGSMAAAQAACKHGRDASVRAVRASIAGKQQHCRQAEALQASRSIAHRCDKQSMSRTTGLSSVGESGAESASKQIQLQQLTGDQSSAPQTDGYVTVAVTTTPATNVSSVCLPVTLTMDLQLLPGQMLDMCGQPAGAETASAQPACHCVRWQSGSSGMWPEGQPEADTMQGRWRHTR